jgi:hypothetical protein
VTEYSGLSLLADVAKELTDPKHAHYPVKRKGERRRLDPNWTGIAWLEADTLEATEILEGDWDAGLPGDGLKRQISRGWSWAKADRTSQGRPIFQAIPLSASSTGPVWHAGCAGCYDFAYSWNCERHRIEPLADMTLPAVFTPLPNATPYYPRGFQPQGLLQCEVTTFSWRDVVEALPALDDDPDARRLADGWLPRFERQGFRSLREEVATMTWHADVEGTDDGS